MRNAGAISGASARLPARASCAFGPKSMSNTPISSSGAVLTRFVAGPHARIKSAVQCTGLAVVALSRVGRTGPKNSSPSSNHSSSFSSEYAEAASPGGASTRSDKPPKRILRGRFGPKDTDRSRSNTQPRRQQQQQGQQQPGQQQPASSENLAWYELPSSTVNKELEVSAVTTDVPDGQFPQDDSQHVHVLQQHQQLGQSSSCSRSSNFSEQLSDRQVQQLRQYLAHMLEVNKSMNLTAIRDPEEAWQRHIEDSLALLPAIDSYLTKQQITRPAVDATTSSSSSSSSSGGGSSGRRLRKQPTAAAAAGAGTKEQQQQPQQQQQQQQLSVIDVGTGAGLPGMVFAVARPHWKVTLLDSLRKRCDFLQQTADMLGLTNVTVVWSRAEDGGRRPDLREAHDLAVARAVADLRVLSELCLPFVKPGGLWVAAKGANPEDEVEAARNAVRMLGGKLLAVERVESWAPEGQRTAVVVAKTKCTPSRFPRAPGTPSKKPL